MLTEEVTRQQKMFPEATTPNHIQLHGARTNKTKKKICKGTILKRNEKVKLEKQKNTQKTNGRPPARLLKSRLQYCQF